MEPMDDSSDTSNQTWLQNNFNSMQLKRSEMNDLIMDYLLHEGFKEAAERFREEAGIEMTSQRLDPAVDADQQDNTGSRATISSGGNKSTRGAAVNKNGANHSSTFNGDDNRPRASNSGKYLLELDDWPKKTESPEMMDRRIEIRQCIEEGDILKGQALINLHYPELLDNNKDLYYKIQQQHIIELIRQQRINDVLSFVHEQFNKEELKDLPEWERTFTLLAYENPEKSPYSNLIHVSHRLRLASEVNDAILQEVTGDIEPSKPRLVTLLKLLFWTQSELERKKIQFPKMTDLVNGTISEPRH